MGADTLDHATFEFPLASPGRAPDVGCSSQVNTISFHELYPSEDRTANPTVAHIFSEGASSQEGEHYCCPGYVSAGLQGQAPAEYRRKEEPCKSSPGSGFVCFLVVLGTAL